MAELEGANTTCFVCGESRGSPEHTLFCPNSLAAVYFTPSILTDVDDLVETTRDKIPDGPPDEMIREDDD